MSIGLADAPASPSDPRAAFYVIDHVAPGTTFDRAVRVSNGGDAPITVELYVGGSTVRDGRLQFDDRAGDDAELSRWSAVSPSRLTVAPRASADAKVTFAVPDSASDGERLGVIWAQPPASGSGTSTVNRVGVRVYLSVGDGAAPRTDFRIDALQASRDASGAPVVTATITNTGGRAIEPTGSATVTGGPTAPAAPGLALLPGQHGQIPARFAGDLGDPPTAVEVVLDANGVERRADAHLTFPSGAGVTTPPVEVAHRAGGSTSATGPAIVAALLAATALAGAVRTRQRRAASS